jgi:hypothetical protein
MPDDAPDTMPRQQDDATAPAPKYSLPEVERRWLVDVALLGPLDGMPYREIEDRYLEGTRLRLRKAVDLQGQIVLKLGKKYGPRDSVEPITNIYLTAAEHSMLSALPGRTLRKRRYSLLGGAIDVYGEQRAIFEMEFMSLPEAQRYVPPAFAVREVTHDPAFSGANLAG